VTHFPFLVVLSWGFCYPYFPGFSRFPSKYSNKHSNNIPKMKTKIVKVTDEGTEVYYAITIPEESDEKYLNRVGLGPHWRTITAVRKNGFSWSGFAPDFAKAYQAGNTTWIETIIRDGLGESNIRLDGTDTATLIKLATLEEDIPDSIDVRTTRKTWANMLYGHRSGD
jgi:hypothetical protein